jgi:ABC-type multidrug transport system fused ATPase/permease subunit
MSHSLVIALIFVGVIILAIVFFKISKWISITLIGAVIVFILAYLFNSDFQSFVRGKSKSVKSELQEKVMEKGKEMGENLKDKVIK